MSMFLQPYIRMGSCAAPFFRFQYPSQMSPAFSLLSASLQNRPSSDAMLNRLPTHTIFSLTRRLRLRPVPTIHVRKLVNLPPPRRQPFLHSFTHGPQPPDVPIRQLRPFDHALVENAAFCYSP